jgi:hypothetical protein
MQRVPVPNKTCQGRSFEVANSEFILRKHAAADPAAWAATARGALGVSLNSPCPALVPRGCNFVRSAVLYL